MVCQAWTAKLNDVRRRKNCLYVSPKTSEFKALDFKAQMLRDGSPCPRDRCCLPVVAPIDLGEEDPEEVAAADHAEDAEMAA